MWPRRRKVVTYRRIPEPDSEVMALSADGVMVHLREEGWKEARVASVSAVPVCVEGELRQKGSRVWRSTPTELACGMPKPLPTTNWAESYRRGVEKAKRIVCINDGAKSGSG